MKQNGDEKGLSFAAGGTTLQILPSVSIRPNL
jgi:hypothetical protein